MNKKLKETGLIEFEAWDTKKEMFTNFMIIDNMFRFMDKVTGVWIRDDEQKRFKLLQNTGCIDKAGKRIENEVENVT